MKKKRKRQAGKTPIIIALVLVGLMVYRTMADAKYYRQKNTEVVYTEPAETEIPLVNRTHPVDENMTLHLTPLKNGQYVAEEILPDLQNLMDAARYAGYSPYVRCGYRSYEEQNRVMQETIRKQVEQGYDAASAENIAMESVAVPGYSEHQLGLAVDIDTEVPDETQALYSWLDLHAADYGFIVRYPADKTYITQTVYEPWHLRYVGVEVARYIRDNGLCLEEYIGR